MTQILYPQALTSQHIETCYPVFWDEELIRLVRFWLKDLMAGVRPLTIRTIQTYRERFIRYTVSLREDLKASTIELDDCLKLENVYAAISRMEIESFSNRHNTFYAIHSFGRFLIRISKLEEEYIPRLMKFRPKRIVAPKRTVLRDQATVGQVRRAIKRDDFKNDWGYLSTKTIVETFMATGLRCFELCQLSLDDVCLNDRVIIVRKGKGRKNRCVGISGQLLPVLEDYLMLRNTRNTTSNNFFLNFENMPFHTVSLARVIKKLSKRSGIPITSHGFRRTFATLNAEQGRPLHLIQLALGHQDIRTTQEYLMSDQTAVIEAMKDW
jgi:site-specific recombinase XerD